MRPASMKPASMKPASMKVGSIKLAAVLVVFTLALAGCSPPPVPDVTYFRLPAPAALPHAAGFPLGVPLRLEGLGIECFFHG